VRYFLDTEFNGFGGELISLALVPEHPHFAPLYLALPLPAPETIRPWVAENVVPIIATDFARPDRVDRQNIGQRIAWYLRDDRQPIIVADWPDDIRYFCQAIITGPGMMAPIPSLGFHLVRIDSYPSVIPGAVQHNALWDARALRAAALRMTAADFA